MPDPISCQLDTSQSIPTFDCDEVVIEGSAEPNASTTKIIELDVPMPGLGEVLAERGAECFSEVNAVAILLAAGSKSPVAGLLAGLKTGFDLAQCSDSLVQQSHQEDVQRARDAIQQDCLHRGGIVAGRVGNETTCYVEVKTP